VKDVCIFILAKVRGEYIVVAAGSSKSSGFCIRVEMYHKLSAVYSVRALPWWRKMAAEAGNGSAASHLCAEVVANVHARPLRCHVRVHTVASSVHSWCCRNPRNLLTVTVILYTSAKTEIFQAYLHSFERFSRPLLRGCKPPPSWICRWGCCVRLANILG